MADAQTMHIRHDHRDRALRGFRATGNVPRMGCASDQHHPRIKDATVSPTDEGRATRLTVQVNLLSPDGGKKYRCSKTLHRSLEREVQEFLQRMRVRTMQLDAEDAAAEHQRLAG